MRRFLRISRRSVVHHSELWLDRATQRGPKRCLFSGSTDPELRLIKVFSLLFAFCFLLFAFYFLQRCISMNNSPWSTEMLMHSAHISPIKNAELSSALLMNHSSLAKHIGK